MGSLQMAGNSPHTALPESSCAYLRQELKMIWDEVGQEEYERERILQEVEQECLEVYKRKVNSANLHRIQLHQALAEAEAEFTNLLLSLGERSFPGRPDKMVGTLKEQLNSITPALQEMQLRKETRVRLFMDVQTEIQRISSEITGNSEKKVAVVNQEDLSLKKLEEYQADLRQLKKEKAQRLCKVEEYKVLIHNLSTIMGMDPSKILAGVHPNLLDGLNGQTKSISDDILNNLNRVVQSLKEEKHLRMEKLDGLGKALTNLWNILDTKTEDRQLFAHLKIFSSLPSDSVISSPGSLTLDKIQQVESEVHKLDKLKATKMQELFLKKQAEIEDVCKKSHMNVPYNEEMENFMHLIMLGEMDHDDLLKILEEYICKAKEEASSRKDIIDKVEKWIASCDEERWLEEYSRDEKRYSVSKGAHINLRRAERARIRVNKIPGLVQMLMANTKIWEEERKKVFYYDELPLMDMLKEHLLLLKEKEREKYRQREKKMLQTQLAKEQDNSFLSRPNTSGSHPLSRSFINPSSTSISYKRISSVIQETGSDNKTSAEKITDVRKNRYSNAADVER